VFSRTWLAVLAGSAVLWGMNQLGGVAPLPVPDAGGGPRTRAAGSPAVAGVAVPELAACLDAVASLDAVPRAGPPAQDASSVEGRYRDRCRPVLDGAAFDAFAVVYGERSRAVVTAILDREERLAAELVAGPRAAALDPDVVWAAALGRAASDAQAFHVELVAWFDARAVSGGGAAVAAPAGAPAR